MGGYYRQVGRRSRFLSRLARSAALALGVALASPAPARAAGVTRVGLANLVADGGGVATVAALRAALEDRKSVV
jgi:hypothetical protein